MSDHLPECDYERQDYRGNDNRVCYCSRLRACEQRVKRVERPLSFLKGATYGRDCGWDEALDAAEAAVAAVTDGPIEQPYWIDHEATLAAIRSLKEKP